MMENMAKLDWQTGRLELNGIVVRPGMKSAEFRKYGDAVSIMDRGNGRAIIRLKESVYSNGISGWVKITIDDKDKELEVVIEPEADDDDKVLEASKQWLLGVLNREQFQSFSDLVQAEFSWGYIIAQYYSSKDYDEYGGDIEIIFGE